MKIAVIGCNGQLGYDMVSVCRSKGYTVTGIDYPAIDIKDQQLTNTIIKNIMPDVIINCAAYTDVDSCESNIQEAYSVNSSGVANIANAAKSIGTKIVHISTDYVFDGKKHSPYIETDIPNPMSVYGKSKLDGELEFIKITEKYFIFRIAWLYGINGTNFVKTIRKLADKRQKLKLPLKVINDQIGTPTYSKDVCEQIMEIIPTQNFGIYHCTNEGECSWYEFAHQIIDFFNIQVELLPCHTGEFNLPAPRPAYSVLENSHLKSLGIHLMPYWKESLNHFLKEIK